MFLLLLGLSFFVFAPTVLLPILRDYCDLLAEETQLAADVAALEAEVARRDELMYAFKNDAVVNERLAVLDLHYKRPNEVILPVLGDGSFLPHQAENPTQAQASRTALHLPADWPHWALRAESWADSKGLISLFLDPSLRPVFLLMSCGLTIAAFVLFAPRLRLRQHDGSSINKSVASTAQPTS
jgi:hypothetical protein